MATPREKRLDTGGEDQWRALWHPLRVAMLQLLIENSMTNEEMAAALKVASGRLYHHTRLLLKAGMIEIDSTRQKGPITEKLYRATAKSFRSEQGDSQEQAFRSALNLLRLSREMDPSIQPQSLHAILNAPPEALAELTTAFNKLVENAAASAKAPGAKPCAVTLLLHSLPLPNKPNES